MNIIYFRIGKVELTSRETELIKKIIIYKQTVGNRVCVTTLAREIAQPRSSVRAILHKINNCDSMVIDDKVVMPFFWLNQRKLIYTKISNPIIVHWM